MNARPNIHRAASARLGRGFEITAVCFCRTLARLFLALFFIITPFLSRAGDFYFGFWDSANNPQPLRGLLLYPLQQNSVNPNGGFTTADYVAFYTSTNGTVTCSNLLGGTYMGVFIGTTSNTTNYFSLPQTNNVNQGGTLQYASNFVSNGYVIVGSSIPAYSEVQSDARYARIGIGAGNAVTNGQPSVSLGNGTFLNLTIPAGGYINLYQDTNFVFVWNEQSVPSLNSTFALIGNTWNGISTFPAVYQSQANPQIYAINDITHQFFTAPTNWVIGYSNDLAIHPEAPAYYSDTGPELGWLPGATVGGVAHPGVWPMPNVTYGFGTNLWKLANATNLNAFSVVARQGRFFDRIGVDGKLSASNTVSTNFSTGGGTYTGNGANLTNLPNTAMQNTAITNLEPAVILGNTLILTNATGPETNYLNTTMMVSSSGPNVFMLTPFVSGSTINFDAAGGITTPGSITAGLNITASGGILTNVVAINGGSTNQSITNANFTGPIPINSKWFPPNGGIAATNYQWNYVSNGIYAAPALSQTFYGPYNPVFAGYNFFHTNGNAVGGWSYIGDHTGLAGAIGELLGQGQNIICVEPGLGGYGAFQIGVESFPIELQLVASSTADGFPRFSDGISSNSAGHSYPARFFATWSATNAANTLTNTVSSSAGIVAVANNNTNYFPGTAYPGSADLLFYCAAPQYLSGSSSGVQWTNAPGSLTMRLSPNGLTDYYTRFFNTNIFGLDALGNNAFQGRQLGGNQYQFMVGVADAAYFQVQDGFANNLFVVNGPSGAGQSSGGGIIMNQAVTLGVNAYSTYGYALEVYGNTTILSSNSTGYFKTSSGATTNSGNLVVNGTIFGNGSSVTNTAFSSLFFSMHAQTLAASTIYDVEPGASGVLYVPGNQNIAYRSPIAGYASNLYAFAYNGSATTYGSSNFWIGFTNYTKVTGMAVQLNAGANTTGTSNAVTTAAVNFSVGDAVGFFFNCTNTSSYATESVSADVGEFH